MSKQIVNKKHVIAGLDLGTTKAVFIIGVIGPNGIEVVGLGHAPNTGVRQGVVVNIDATVEAIKKAREEAELMAGIHADSIWLGIAGTHIQSFDSSGMVAIHGEVKQDDIHRVIEAAKAVVIPTDRQVLHVLPRDFKIDHQEGINDPIGMSGVRLETSVHIITGSSSHIQNAIKCTEKVGLEVSGLVLQQLASAMSVVSADEKGLGVSVVDMGGGTCDLITFAQGSVVHTAQVPVGGQNFTHDVAMGLKTTQANAETLKKKHGCAIQEAINEEETIEVEGVGGRQARTISRKNLCEILSARAEETLTLVKDVLENSGWLNRLGSGVILTGGGSQLEGLAEMGDYVFDVPVRKGSPQQVGGLTDVVKCASYSTAVGLLLYGLRQEKDKVTTIINEDDFIEKLGSWARRVKDLWH